MFFVVSVSVVLDDFSDVDFEVICICYNIDFLVSNFVVFICLDVDNELKEEQVVDVEVVEGFQEEGLFFDE